MPRLDILVPPIFVIQVLKLAHPKQIVCNVLISTLMHNALNVNVRLLNNLKLMCPGKSFASLHTKQEILETCLKMRAPVLLSYKEDDLGTLVGIQKLLNHLLDLS